MKKISLISTMLIFLASSAFAVLQDNDDNTVTQIRNDGSLLMWLQDANYAMTSGYDADGLMTWNDAITWIGILNSSNYLGYDDWRLPDTSPINGSTFDYSSSFDGSTDLSYNISAPGSAYPRSTSSDMAYMFYTELGNKGYYDISGDSPQPDWGLVNTGPFANLQNYAYWSNTEYAPNLNEAWFFVFDDGPQHNGGKSNIYNAWAVRDVTVVPEPISSTLFIIGGATLGIRRFIRKR